MAIQKICELNSLSLLASKIRLRVVDELDSKWPLVYAFFRSSDLDSLTMIELDITTVCNCNYFFCLLYYSLNIPGLNLIKFLGAYLGA